MCVGRKTVPLEGFKFNFSALLQIILVLEVIEHIYIMIPPISIVIQWDVGTSVEVPALRQLAITASASATYNYILLTPHSPRTVSS